MFLDANLIFSSAQAITVTAASTNIIDLAGVGSGNAPPNSFGVSNSIFGEDIGIGDGASPPQLVAYVGTAFTAGGAGTLTIAVQSSIDSGSPGYTPASWVTDWQTDALSLAQLAAGTRIQLTWPPRPPLQTFPRFLRLYYTVATGPMTGGTIAFAGIATGVDNAPIYPKNYA